MVLLLAIISRLDTIIKAAAFSASLLFFSLSLSPPRCLIFSSSRKSIIDHHRVEFYGSYFQLLMRK